MRSYSFKIKTVSAEADCIGNIFKNKFQKFSKNYFRTIFCAPKAIHDSIPISIICQSVYFKRNFD